MRDCSEPEVRSCIVADIRDTLVERYPEHARAQSLALRDVLGTSPPAAWIPASWLLELQERMLAAGGDELVVDVCRRAVDRSHQSALLNAVRAQAMKLIGSRPQLIYRWVPGARAMTVRGLGAAVYEEAEAGCRIIVAQLSPALQSHRGLRLGTRGSLLGLLDVMKLAGEVDVEPRDDRVMFHVRWWKRTGDDGRRPEQKDGGGYGSLLLGTHRP